MRDASLRKFWRRLTLGWPDSSRTTTSPSNRGAIREIAQCPDNVRVLTIEQFVPLREWVHAAIRFHGNGTIAIEFDFEEPLGAVRQFRDGAQSIGSMKSAFPFARCSNVGTGVISTLIEYTGVTIAIKEKTEGP